MSKATEISDQIIRAAIFDVGLGSIKAAAIANSPWLGLPVINQIFNLLLNTIGNKLYEALSNSVDFTIIKFETEAQKKAYDEALADLRTTIKKPEISQDEINRAREELRKRLAALIRFK